MAKFNKKDRESIKTTSYEGGVNYIKSPIEEWLNFLFSSYMEDAYYETAEKQRNRFLDLTSVVADKYGYEFVAKCAIFAREILGMRSVSQLTAAWLNDKKFDRKRAFYAKYPTRPDDVAEIFAALETLEQKYSHALNRGFADYLSTLSDYSIGKYQMKGKQWNMHDIINRTHAYSNAINAYQKGILNTVDTWEVAISGAQSQEQKEEEWKRLVEEHKLGYIALIRNLRNICNCSFATDNWIVYYLVPQIIDAKAIQNSMVFPYQIYSASKYCDISNLHLRLALSDAFKISVANMPILKGNAVILLDVSGSMESPISRNSKISIKEAGAVYAAALMLANVNIDFIKFGTQAKKYIFRPNEDIFTIIRVLAANDNCGFGTEITPAFNLLDKPYDKIFIISDMQIMDSRSNHWYYEPFENMTFNNYCQEFNSNCKLYSFDLGNYHSQLVNPGNPNVYLLTSLSDKTFEFIDLLDQGDSIVDYINNVIDY